jgi:hypothetical protein
MFPSLVKRITDIMRLTTNTFSFTSFRGLLNIQQLNYWQLPMLLLQPPSEVCLQLAT